MSMACRRTTLRRVLEVVERCHRKATGALSDAASTAVVSQSRKIASSTNSLALVCLSPCEDTVRSFVNDFSVFCSRFALGRLVID